MPIDRLFQQNWQVGKPHRGHTVWTCPSARLGIHGTRVAVDLDICTGCMKCLAVCPVAVFVQWEPGPGKMKVDPVKESECLECLICEIVCPVEAILITRATSPHDTLKALLE